MPLQAPQWTEFLLCHVCCKQFDCVNRQPVSLGCGHTVCQSCLSKLNRQQCPFDQAEIKTDIKDLPVNHALMQLVGGTPPDTQPTQIEDITSHQADFDAARKSIEILTLYLKPLIQTVSGPGGTSQNSLGNVTFNGLTRQMQRKLVTLVNCQLVEEEGRCRAVRAARSLGERAVKELILLHQNPQQLSTNLWTAVRLRGCQFLGPAMQDEVLRLIVLSLDGGSSLCRKVLVLYVVQKLEETYSQASKTSIGHVVQLLYRASCFKVTKRDGESSLLQLQDKYRTLPALRKEHDAQIVKIAMEAGLHISPEQWSSLLYGDDDHKSHMQSIIDKLQTPESFGTSIHELLIALQKTGDPSDLQLLCNYLERLAKIDPNPEGAAPSWDELEEVLNGLQIVIHGLVDFAQTHNYMKMKSSAQSAQSTYSKFKTRMCRDVKLGTCPRGENCSFAHTDDELKRYDRHRRHRTPSQSIGSNGLMKPSSSPDGIDFLEDESDLNGFAFKCGPDGQLPNGCSPDQMHNGMGIVKPAGGNPQPSDAYAVPPRPMTTMSAPSHPYYMPVNAYSHSNGLVPATLPGQHFQADNYPKKYQGEPPGLSYCVQAAQMQPPPPRHQQLPTTVYGGNPLLNYGYQSHPQLADTYTHQMYPQGSVFVNADMGAYGIYARSAAASDKEPDNSSDNTKRWKFASSGLPGLSQSLDDASSSSTFRAEVRSPMSGSSSSQGSPKSQSLGSDSGSSVPYWGSLFSNKSDSFFSPSNESQLPAYFKSHWSPLDATEKQEKDDQLLAQQAEALHLSSSSNNAFDAKWSSGASIDPIGSQRERTKNLTLFD